MYKFSAIVFVFPHFLVNVVLNSETRRNGNLIRKVGHGLMARNDIDCLRQGTVLASYCVKYLDVLRQIVVLHKNKYVNVYVSYFRAAFRKKNVIIGRKSVL
jgi:hypothetical protein